MLLALHQDNPESRLVRRIAAVLEDGGVIVYPTDSVYAFGCDATSKRAVEKLYRVTKADKVKLMTLVCAEFSQVSEFARVSQFAFRTMKQYMPGPFVFVLEASRMVPKLLLQKRKTIGVRIPANPIAQSIVAALGRPLLTTSVKDEDGFFISDPEVIHDVYRLQVELVIDGGLCGTTPSTVIDLIGDEAEVIREGKGEVSST